MDTELLKTFLEVSRTRHFGKAAETLYLTQSAVSFRIRQLENQVGTELFTRHRNNIQLTPAGQKLVPYAESLMNTWQLAKQEMIHAGQAKTFSIGAPTLLWESVLAEWLPQLYRDNPSLQLEIRSGQRHTHIRQLHERQLDLLIATEIPKADEFSSTQVGEFHLALYVSKDSTPKKTQPFIQLDWGADFLPHPSSINHSMPPLLDSSSLLIAERILRQTHASAFFPETWASRAENELKRVEQVEKLIRPVYAIWLHNSDRQEEIAQMVDSLSPLFINHA
ncbi:HTH-type transcriptional regulator HdfR [Edwardsiella tarda]|uniref:HTH-type transcriptional regulator HdfR n=2 Tax=Edwardsiella tarda TaxID=636 RepID=D4F9N6_EDWTA|nr:HTH-type transcriptional regulator HdfR [Edwardsiella tarda]EFE21474.1 transcriptional regulator, LysR family [Edwardsiella tarda ATCC 23685]UAL56800.1 HTH-type transcriptional regulator HdfR [Edwardsiella tarda]UCQ00144.1 HTH-type transcriptional regulator HdfR [Edwardsiella tarda ATCC 15947 = NBRC 105688]STD31584.1 HTH-type transcriptional regulator gltR [Edwardsiella tarda]STD50047.1 HTH-type transcriptional regulator gltR [Edwardsiella tarda]